MRRIPLLVICVGLVSGGGAGNAWAGAIEVNIELPRASRIDLSAGGYETIAVEHFLPAEESDRSDYAFEREAARFFERLMKKEAPLDLVEHEPEPLPFGDLDELTADEGFWRTRADEIGADLILTGRVLFKTSNRSGYVQNEYQSAVTGRMYQDRPTFVYRSGITLAVDVVLIEGSTGEVLYKDRFIKDRTVDGSGGDPLSNFFDLMRGLSTGVMGIVSPQKMMATRFLLD